MLLVDGVLCAPKSVSDLGDRVCLPSAFLAY